MWAAKTCFECPYPDCTWTGRDTPEAFRAAKERQRERAEKQTERRGSGCRIITVVGLVVSIATGLLALAVCVAAKRADERLRALGRKGEEGKRHVQMVTMRNGRPVTTRNVPIARIFAR